MFSRIPVERHASIDELRSWPEDLGSGSRLKSSLRSVGHLRGQVESRPARGEIKLPSPIRGLPRLRTSTETAGGGSERAAATVKRPNGAMRLAELHWYEASGIGKKEFKIERFVD
jgi:hypothetical protein